MGVSRREEPDVSGDHRRGDGWNRLTAPHLAVLASIDNHVLDQAEVERRALVVQEGHAHRFAAAWRLPPDAQDRTPSDVTLP
ncbi:MAG: hypothetical protein DCC49_02995 [Acidobacteria bacterium]|nr:MAG: hypothetical protein DCC49_02995 [Acidobacteriota bacterium]